MASADRRRRSRCRACRAADRVAATATRVPIGAIRTSHACHDSPTRPDGRAAAIDPAQLAQSSRGLAEQQHIAVERGQQLLIWRSCPTGTADAASVVPPATASAHRPAARPGCRRSRRSACCRSRSRWRRCRRAACARSGRRARRSRCPVGTLRWRERTRRRCARHRRAPGDGDSARRPLRPVVQRLDLAVGPRRRMRPLRSSGAKIDVAVRMPDAAARRWCGRQVGDTAILERERLAAGRPRRSRSRGRRATRTASRRRRCPAGLASRRSTDRGATAEPARPWPPETPAAGRPAPARVQMDSRLQRRA